MKSDHEVIIDTEKCIGCGLCEKDCPTYNIQVKNEKAVLCGILCLKCGHCAAVCPKNAIELTGFDDAPLPVSEKDMLDSDELLRAIKARRSVRHFRDTPVERGKLDKIIEAGRYTPSGGNSQGVSYILITEDIPSVEEKAVAFLRPLKSVGGVFNRTLREFKMDSNFYFNNAPAVIVVICRNKVDGALAASNMELMAEAQGLGVLYSGLFAIAAGLSHRVRMALGLKRGEKVVTALVIGYPDVRYFRTAQKERASVREL
jgi:nitroreductase/NAD-dependent dihydropyrimidine dehydrogenase PreA subunit